MPVTIYLKSHQAWPLLGSLEDGRFYVGDRAVHASLIDRYELDQCHRRALAPPREEGPLAASGYPRCIFS
jgi:hypothetical protein